SSMGGALGVLLAHWGVDALLAFAPSNIPRLESVSIDKTVLLFSGATVCFVSIALGVFTALRAASVGDGQAALQTRGQTESREKQWAGKVISIGQLAAALEITFPAHCFSRDSVWPREKQWAGKVISIGQLAAALEIT